tara:strand:+ start:26512 stop:27282 length:771 start_codon:yes stop_codon:yes gene_type:complete
VRLYSKIYGDKNKDLIILHGLFGMSDNWNTLGKQFSKNYRVHLIDLRNHGRSPHSQEFNYDVMCSDILEYIQINDINKPILLGHSLGGKVAMKFAFTYKDKIEKLIVADIAPRRYDTDFAEKVLQTLYRLPLENFEKREEIDETLSSIYSDRGMRLFLMKNLFRNENKAFDWRFNLNVLLDNVTNIQEADFIKGICDTPTLFMKGGGSSYITSEDEVIIKKHFSNCSIVTIEDAGHWLHAENPEEFYDEVMRFCLI